MPDYSQFFKKPDDPDAPASPDQDKLQAYSNYLDTSDPKQKLKDMMDQRQADKEKAVDIASRSPFQDKTPEEQDFEEQHLDPMTRGLVQGGAMGSVNTIGKLGQTVDMFPKTKQMFQVGSHVFEASNPAEALKIKDALEKTMQTMPGRPLIKL